jgi:hypothetical protein
VANLVARNVDENRVALMVGYGGVLASVALKMFSHFINLERKVLNFVLLMRFAKINFITIQHKTLILVNFDGPY